MKFMRILSTRRTLVAFVVLALCRTPHALAQEVLTDLSSASNQADYVIITPASYVDVLTPLAEFRSLHDGLKTVFALTDSIYTQFGLNATPDTAVKAFITHGLDVWSDPKPRFFLLGGNINAVPGHRVKSVLSEYVAEDSILLDSWFIMAGEYPVHPRAALGRFPAWDATQLATLVNKTITYSSRPLGAWAQRSIGLADSGASGLFEQDADRWQGQAVPLWPDTLTGHVDPASARSWTTGQFVQSLANGAAIVSYWGHANAGQLGSQAFFTPADVQMLPPGSPLALWQLYGSHPFDVQPSASVILALLLSDDRGAVAVSAPSGVHYAGGNATFRGVLLHEMLSAPEVPIGIHLQVAIQSLIFSDQSLEGRLTLHGDPALVIASALIAGVDPPGSAEVPSQAALYQNYPNPFNPSTTIRYGLPVRSHVTLTIFNTLGQQVATLVEGEMEAGYHEVHFDAARLGSGVYVYRLVAGAHVLARKLILLR